MLLTNCCDKGELRKYLRIYTDTRFDDYDLEKAVLKASDEIKSALRPHYKVDMFDLSAFSDLTLSGTVTTGGSNTLTDSGQTWTINEFKNSVIGFDVEVIIWNSSAFYIADITANTATGLTFSSIDGATITTTENDEYYLRKKNPTINSMGINLSAYHFFASNRLARGIQNIQEILQELKNGVYSEIVEYTQGLRDFGYYTLTDTITLNGNEWQSLTAQNIVPLTETVNKSSVVYKDFQGYDINYQRGLIRWKSSTHSTYLSSSDLISITYSVSLCRHGGFGYGG